MVKLRVISDTANLRSEPSSAEGDATVIASFQAGAPITQLGYAQIRPDWIRAEASDGTKRLYEAIAPRAG